MRILLVEDDDMLRNLMEELLRQSGAFVETAATCTDACALLWSAALAAAEDGNPVFDAAILDNRLPDGLGIDLLPAIRRLVPRVVMATSDGFSEDFQRRAKALGAEQVFTKPLNLLDLARYFTGCA